VPDQRAQFRGGHADRLDLPGRINNFPHRRSYRPQLPRRSRDNFRRLCCPGDALGPSSQGQEMSSRDAGLGCCDFPLRDRPVRIALAHLDRGSARLVGQQGPNPAATGHRAEPPFSRRALSLQAGQHAVEVRTG
jgi:hypothetical protein